MPADFDRCVKNNGRMSTVSGPNKEHGLKAGQYVRYCYDSSGAHRGHVKTRKGSTLATR